MPEHRLITARLRDHPDDSWTYARYAATGGYQALRKALTMEPQAIQDEVKASGIRGRGGAGFPTATKWSFLAPDLFPRYLVINGDEGEPCTFKDRMLLERDPHQLIEGVVISAYAIGCNKAFIYVRGEFGLAYTRMVRAVAEAHDAGMLGRNILGSGFDLDVVVHRAAGAYICGEETALIESLEGQRGMPRIKPPFPAVAGLYAKPTVVNNVETISTIPVIIERGGEWYGTLGTEKSTGTRVVALAGHVNKPGNYEIEFGLTWRELFEEYGGGIPGGKRVKFFVPGGASSQWLTDAHLDEIYDLDVAAKLGVMLGSGAVMVFDETVDPVKVAWRLVKFFAHESCGKCTPCREGAGWMEKILYRIWNGHGRPGDFDLLYDIGDNISPGVVNAPFAQTTICPLGPSPVASVASLHKYFRAEVDAHIEAAGRSTANAVRIPVTAGGH
jgi:NADH-quinone oxidoreductase subunit F